MKQSRSFAELQGWEKRGFDITAAQSVNVAVDALGDASTIHLGLNPRVKDIAKEVFKLLLLLREDKELQNMYAEAMGKVEPTGEVAL